MFESELQHVRDPHLLTLLLASPPKPTHRRRLAASQATEECASDKKNYQSELSDMFSRRIKKLEDDLKVLETEGTLDNVKPQVDPPPPLLPHTS